MISSFSSLVQAKTIDLADRTIKKQMRIIITEEDKCYIYAWIAGINIIKKASTEILIEEKPRLLFALQRADKWFEQEFYSKESIFRTIETFSGLQLILVSKEKKQGLYFIIREKQKAVMLFFDKKVIKQIYELLD